MNKPNTILITGVSTGIGYAATEAFIKRGCRVFGSVRKQADADRLKETFGSSFTPLIFDVTDRDAIISGRKVVEQELNGSGLGCLVNNAGIAIGGPLQHLSLDDLRRQLEINVVGLVSVTQEFLPLLGARKDHPVPPGKIINISSSSGKIAMPFLGPYAASKHAVEALSGSLRRELQLYDIDVVIVGPGAVKTPIWDKAEDLPAFEGTDYEEAVKNFQSFAIREGKKGLEASLIGEKIAHIFFNEKPSVRYALVPKKFRRWILPRLLPARRLDKIIGKGMGLIN